MKNNTYLNIDKHIIDEKQVYQIKYIKKDNILLKNPDLYIATISPRKSISIVTYWKKGIGYHDSEEQKKQYFSEDEENDIIVLDTSFSPFKISEISFIVENEIVSINNKIEVLHFVFNKSHSINPKFLLKEALDNSKNLFNYLIKIIDLQNEKEK